MTRPAEDVKFPPFEIRNVRLDELARSIAFLSQGALTVEVADQMGYGKIWRIGTPEAPTFKMRAVAVPHLFADAARVQALVESAQRTDRLRLELVRPLASLAFRRRCHRAPRCELCLGAY